MKVTRASIIQNCSDSVRMFLHCRSVFFWFLFFLAFACQTEEPVIVVPQETPYLGIWTGNTSQMTFIEIEVSEIDSRQVLYSLRFTYLSDSSIKQRYIFSEKGLFWIEENHFAVDLPDGGNVTGTFYNQNHLSGTINVLLENSSFFELNYSTTNQDSAVTINSISRTSMHVNDNIYHYEQVINDLFPYTITEFTDSSFIAGAEVKIEKGMYQGTSVFRFNAGAFGSAEEVREFFSVGNKPYASMDEEGIEVLFYNPDIYYELSSSRYETGNQQDSYFRIVDTKPVVTDISGISRLKIMVEYGCTVYDIRGDSLEIRNGFFLGFVDLPNLEE
jgi:hypothetical protein